jgi:hypothetical protein
LNEQAVKREMDELLKEEQLLHEGEVGQGL